MLNLYQLSNLNEPQPTKTFSAELELNSFFYLISNQEQHPKLAAQLCRTSMQRPARPRPARPCSQRVCSDISNSRHNANLPARTADHHEHLHNFVLLELINFFILSKSLNSFVKNIWQINQKILPPNSEQPCKANAYIQQKFPMKKLLPKKKQSNSALTSIDDTKKFHELQDRCQISTFCFLLFFFSLLLNQDIFQQPSINIKIYASTIKKKYK